MIRDAIRGLRALPLALATAVFLCVGCAKKPTDAQLTTDVQKQIAADTALQGQPISVAANNGVVTLTGTVSGPSSRELAANDASKVSGVKTVVNDLATANASDMGAAPATAQSAQGTAPGAAQATAPQPIVVPKGTRIRVRLGETLSTKESQTGDSFSGVVADPVRVNGQTVIRPGARTQGVVTESKGLGKFKGQAVLAIRLESVSADGRTYPVRTGHVERVEQGKGKRSAVLTGGGAGIGALIGGLAGGGKGALVGGLVGGGGGAAGSAFTGNKDLVIPAESILTFVLERSLTVTR
ncbi:MAG TPA: BON domain-containing protein [Acidobacteriaceae bacterium]|nr:BON domain-containing protein [Acidobacteriaceae bacterium]